MKSFLLSLTRSQKVIILLLGDFLIGFITWAIFGSPTATFLSSNFEASIEAVIVSQFTTFIYPMIFAISALYILGFYKSLTRFKSTEEGFLKAFLGAGIFGITYILFFISEQDVVQKNYVFIFIIQGFLLGSIFLSGILFARESAKFFLGHSSKDVDATPLIIYGAGAIGQCR